MTWTLATLTYRVAREIGVDFLKTGTATGGNTTTVADTNDRTEADDFWNSGSIWIVYDAGGAGAAPEGQYSAISDFANTGGVVTLRTALTIAAASGDRYAITKDHFPLNLLNESVNHALFNMGRIPITDITSLTIAANQTEYSVPIAANTDLREVWIQGQTDDSNDNRWIKLYNWYLQRTATGTADLLILPSQPPTDYDLKLVYLDSHPQLFLYGDKLSETVPYERVIYPAALYCMRWWRDKYRDDRYKERILELEALEDRAKRMHPIPSPPRTPRGIVTRKLWTTQGDYDRVNLG